MNGGQNLGLVFVPVALPGTIVARPRPLPFPIVSGGTQASCVSAVGAGVSTNSGCIGANASRGSDGTERRASARSESDSTAAGATATVIVVLGTTVARGVFRVGMV